MELYRTPASRFVAEFIGAPPMNVYDLGLPGGQALAALAGGPRRRARMLAGIRPEALHISREGPSGDVILVEALGAESLIHLRMGEDRMILRGGAAEALGFLDLPEEMKPLIAPQDPNAEFVGFYAQSGDGAPYFLGVARGDLDGRSFAICSITNPYVETALVVSALENFADVGVPDHDESAMGQRYRVWLVDEWSEDAFISLTDAEPMGYRGATLAISAPSVD
jgi:hypothetical protein